VTEADFLRQVTELATLLRWEWVHFRPAMTTKGWRTPVSGPLGKGWPDLVLVRRGRIVFAELKADKGRTSPDQDWVHHVLAGAGFHVYVWRPADLEDIAAVLA